MSEQTDLYKCNYCGKTSTTKRTSSIAQGMAELRHRDNWIIKNLVMYTEVGEWLAFCSIECKTLGIKKYLTEHNVSQDRIDTVKQIIAECRREVPQMAGDVAQHVDGLVSKVVDTIVEHKRKK